MILGTSKISLNLGPINGHFWARGPRIYGFSYTKIPQKILDSIWEHPQTILCVTFWNFEKISNLDPPNTYLFFDILLEPPTPKRLVYFIIFEGH